MLNLNTMHTTPIILNALVQYQLSIALPRIQKDSNGGCTTAHRNVLE
jgi:hypothetical protein